MKLKQYLTLGIGMIAGFGISLAGLSYASKDVSNHANLITSEKAKTIMLNKVPGATILEFSYDGDDRVPKYDATLIKDDYEYEVDVNAETGEVIKFEKEKVSISNSNQQNTNNLITSEKAKTIMMDKVPGATIIEFSYDGDDRIPKYDGTLRKDNYEYEIDVNAKTGEIIKFEKERIATSNNNSNTNGSNNSSTNNQQNITKPGSNTQGNSYIGESKAKSIMLSKVPGATIKKFYLDNDRIPKYEGTLIKGNYEYEIDVNAKTGEVIEFEKERIATSNNNNSNTNGSNNSSTNNQQNVTKPGSNTQGNSYIGEAKAKSIMLSKVPGATIKKFYLDNDSTPEYEAELIKGDFEYEISIDARTGAIREFSKERIEKYDDDRYDDDDDDRYDD